jgi:hypothetical protein
MTITHYEERYIIIHSSPDCRSDASNFASVIFFLQFCWCLKIVRNFYEAHITGLRNHKCINKSYRSLCIKQLCRLQHCVFPMALLEEYHMHSTPQASGETSNGYVCSYSRCVHVGDRSTNLVQYVVCREHLLLTAWHYSGIISSLLGD